MDPFLTPPEVLVKKLPQLISAECYAKPLYSHGFA